MKELTVTGLENGTVIDHIDPKKVFLVVRLLQLHKLSNKVLAGTNFKSSKHDMKGFIKVEDKQLSTKETNKVALVSPNATINIIKDNKIVDKRNVEIPNKVKEIVTCFNPNCITNKEEVTTDFNVINKKPLQLQCTFCERVMGRGEIRVK